MKPALIVLMCSIFPVTCIVVAGTMAVNGISGWGWFLLVALLGGLSYKSGDDEKEQK